MLNKKFTLIFMMQNLVKMRKIDIYDVDYIGKSLKPNIDTSTDASSDHLI